MADPFSKYKKMVEEADAQEEVVTPEEVVAQEDAAAPEELTATAESINPFDKYAAMAAEEDAAPGETAAVAQPEDNSMTKQLAGFIEENVLGPTGLKGAIEGAKEFAGSVYRTPGQVAADPIGAAAAAGGGIAAGAADLLDTLVNVGAAAGRAIPNIPGVGTMTGGLAPMLAPLAPAATALDLLQQKVLGGQPLNLKGAVEAAPVVKQAAGVAPDVYKIAQGLPMGAVTVGTGGSSLASRLGIGAVENLAQGTLSGLNEQIKANLPTDLGAAIQQALPGAWLGGGLAGALGRRTQPRAKAPAPAPAPASAPAKWIGGEASPEALYRKYLENQQQKQAEPPVSPTYRKGVNPGERHLPVLVKGDEPKTNAQWLGEGSPKLTADAIASRWMREPSKGPSPTYRKGVNPESGPPLLLPDKDKVRPPRITEFTKRIRKDGDLAHSPGVPGFRRVKGAAGQSKNKVELVDGEGNVINDADGKPVSWSWKTLDDEIKPKSIPGRLMESLKEAREKAPQKAPEPAPAPKVESEPVPVQKPAPAPEPEPASKAPEPEPPTAKASPAEPEYDAGKVVNASKAKLDKMDGEMIGRRERLRKLETKDVKEQLKLNKETGEMEPPEVRAERARGYIEKLKKDQAALEQALERYQEAVSKDAESGGDFGKAALKGLVEQLKSVGTKMEGLLKEEAGSGEIGFNPILSGLGAGYKFISDGAKKLNLGEEATTQAWRGFAEKVDRNLSTFFNKLKTPEERAEIVTAIKGAIGLMNDADIIQKFDPHNLSVSLSRHRAVLESLMYDAKLPVTVAERDAFAKTRLMTVDEVLSNKELKEVLSEEQIGWLAATKQATDALVEDVRARYGDEDVSGPYKAFLSDYYRALTDRPIEGGAATPKGKADKVARHITNAMYDNIVKGNWTIHSIHVWDAIVHGGSYLGKHFWSGATKAYANPTVKNYVRGYKGSGLMKSARSGDAPTILEKTVGGFVDRIAAKNKLAAGALKIGQALEGGWLEGEKMHVLRAGVLERTAKDMGIKGGAEALVKKLATGELSPGQILELNSRQAVMLNDIIGYNPTGIVNRNVMQRHLPAVGKVLQPFIGMRTVQSRLGYDMWGKAVISGKVSDLKNAAMFHGLLALTGGSSTLTKTGKLAIKLGLGSAALNETEKFLDGFKILPKISISHLTPDMVPALFMTFDNASRMAASLGKFMEKPLDPKTLAKEGVTAIGSVIGGSVGSMPSAYNIKKFAQEMTNAAQGFKETYAFDETAIGRSEYAGKVLVGKYDMFDALLSFMSPHDLDKTHHGKEAVVHRDRILEEIGSKYGSVARIKAARAIPAQTEYDWNAVSEWAKKNFDNPAQKQQQEDYEKGQIAKKKKMADLLTR